MLIQIEDLTVEGKKQGSVWKRAVGCLKRRLCSEAENRALLKNITGSFSCGIHVILGPNGSGKSTLLQVLDGFILPDTGRVLLDGQAARPSVLRQNIGYLPQVFGFYPQLTAREMLDYIALLKGIMDNETRKCNVEEVLQRMGLLAVADRKVGTYSRGMRQKVGIAQALLGDPPILILDEPTAGLDPDSRNSLRRMLVELGQEQVVIWASSLITDTYCADQVLILGCGESRFWGTPAELMARAEPPMRQTAFFKNIADEGHWYDIMEQGYRAILSSCENR